MIFIKHHYIQDFPGHVLLSTKKRILNCKIFLLDTDVGTCINPLLHRSFSLAWLSALFHHHSETFKKQITMVHKHTKY